MNVQELETAARLKVSIITIVWCDAELGMISLKQTDEFGKSAFTRFNNPDFVKLAESFGAKGYDLKSSIELPKILEEVKELTDVPVTLISISVDIDYSRNRILIDDNLNG